ncbi:hypothetical protein U8C32_03370 [Sinorhizobium medicae]|uniref:hypothetical protein n=1 Tax=Sinorhizobium TaxID=28105 RepID=UPI000FDA1257|nr:MULTISPECIES: hypothetical protein [Sinorhizobium]RVI25398.1 hypothetical protein CN202_21745 [Sinorhizobium meliloti]WQO46076.1 hypothetical protein U8C42_03435 [Sinorhizobium medicae]WQO66196.1 hypothetical protein U8C40_03155 [Sinorhizobium medicae]WQO73329.1 hypothetical protein U8C31_03155 [Sinorhizobium medicae]WQO92669.1 hypothetical protein U8C32_03370 [Sinorhizobium medicae]
MKHDRDDHSLPEESAYTDEKPVPDTPKRTIADRLKLVGIVCEDDPARLKALEYLGRRWLSLNNNEACAHAYQRRS